MSQHTTHSRPTPRHKSLSYSSSTTPFTLASGPPPAPCGGRPLHKASSIADLRATLTSRPRFLRRFTSKDKDLFGCAGEQGGAFGASSRRGSSELDLDELNEEEEHDLPDALPPYGNPAPARPAQVGVEDSCIPQELWSKEQIREVERRKEEQAAEDALAVFFARQSFGSNKSTRTSASSASDSHNGGLSRSDSSVSFSTSSSRPRTNDSLPSYHSNGPPSPASERGGTLRRPKAPPAPTSSIALAEVVAERRYDFI